VTYLLLPAYNEEKNLPELIRRGLSANLIPLVVDDGSTDGTARVAEALGAQVIRHETNRGLAEALRTLFREFLARAKEGDWAVTMDADGTMDPYEAPGMIQAGKEHGADIVIASRFRGGGARGLSPARRLFSWGARIYLSLMAPVPGVTDYTTGYRAYRAEFLRAYAERFPDFFETEAFAAATELLLRARTLGARVVEVPTTIRYDQKAGESKMELWPTVRAYLELGLKARRWTPHLGDSKTRS